MLQDSSQNDTSLPDKLQVWFEWLAKNTYQGQGADSSAASMLQPKIGIPDSLIEMLRCVISISSSAAYADAGQKKLHDCLEKLHHNREDISVFFKALQNKPTFLIEVMQKLGRPMPLPLNDLLCAMEEVADDKSESSNDLREAIINYLKLLKCQQLEFVSLMEASLKVVSQRKTTDFGNSVRSFMDEWVQEFETEFVLVACRDEYAKDLGQLINASIQVLKNVKLYRAQKGVNAEVP